MLLKKNEVSGNENVSLPSGVKCAACMEYLGAQLPVKNAVSTSNPETKNIIGKIKFKTGIGNDSIFDIYLSLHTLLYEN